MEVEVLSMAMVRRAESDTPRQEAVEKSMEQLEHIWMLRCCNAIWGSCDGKLEIGIFHF